MFVTWKYKFWAFVLAVVAAVYILVPSFIGLRDIKDTYEKAGEELPWIYSILPEKELNLGLDLRGGLYMELEVGIDDAVMHQIDSVVSDIQRVVIDGQKLANANVNQIPGKKIRVQYQAADESKFKNELYRYFGSDYFELTKENQEFFYKFSGDPAEAKKQVFTVLSALKPFQGDVSLVNGDKLIAISYASAEEKQKVSELMGGEQAAGFQDVTASVADFAYLSFSQTRIDEFTKNIIEQAANSVRNRIDRFGVAEASVSRQASDRLVVELPGVKDPDTVIDIIRRTGKLEFRIVSDKLDNVELTQLVNAKVEELKIKRETVFEKENVALINKGLRGDLPDGTEVAFQIIRDPQTKKVTASRAYLLEKAAEVTGDMLEKAGVQTENNLPQVSMGFNKVGAQKFGDLTAKNIGRQLAVVLDGVVNTAPNIDESIYGGQAVIRLGYGDYRSLYEEARKIVLVLKEGALPASLKVATKSIIGPSLGQESINAGLNSLLIAALAVLIFMIVYYKVGGMVANVALGVNVLFIFAVLTQFQASLTLPGIAGIVLTLGMAVDANVIIFERMKEEKVLGRKVGEVVDSGYGHAMSAIIDGNITTFISGLVLFQFGTGPIKGFATTLMIGIATTLITAIVLTRVIYDWMLESMKMKEIKI